MAKEINNDAEKRGQYPYTGLQKALEFAAAVAELGGDRMEVQKSVVAHRLNLDESGAVYTQTVSAAKCFGAIGGRGAYVLTELGKGYFSPTTDTEKRIALLKMLKEPEVYAKLIDRFDGSKLPSGEILANIIGRDYGVSKSWAPRVASMFVTAIRDGGALDTNGFVRYAASMHARQVPSMVSPAAHEPPAPPQSSLPSPLASTAITPVSPDTNVWQFRLGESIVRLETSRDLSRALWDKLNQYVKVLEPDKDKSAV